MDTEVNYKEVIYRINEILHSTWMGNAASEEKHLSIINEIDKLTPEELSFQKDHIDSWLDHGYSVEQYLDLIKLFLSRAGRQWKDGYLSDFKIDDDLLDKMIIDTQRKRDERAVASDNQFYDQVAELDYMIEHLERSISDAGGTVPAGRPLLSINQDSIFPVGIKLSVDQLNWRLEDTLKDLLTAVNDKQFFLAEKLAQAVNRLRREITDTAAFTDNPCPGVQAAEDALKAQLIDDIQLMEAALIEAVDNGLTDKASGLDYLITAYKDLRLFLTTPCDQHIPYQLLFKRIEMRKARLNEVMGYFDDKASNPLNDDWSEKIESLYRSSQVLQLVIAAMKSKTHGTGNPEPGITMDKALTVELKDNIKLWKEERRKAINNCDFKLIREFDCLIKGCEDLLMNIENSPHEEKSYSTIYQTIKKSRPQGLICSTNISLNKR